MEEYIFCHSLYANLGGVRKLLSPFNEEAPTWHLDTFCRWEHGCLEWNELVSTKQHGDDKFGFINSKEPSLLI